MIETASDVGPGFAKGILSSGSAEGRNGAECSPPTRHFLALMGLSTEDGRELLERAIRLKAEDDRRAMPLRGRILGLFFEKPSLRTRVSFEAAIARLGGTPIFLHGKDVQIGVRESVADFARVISQYVDALAVRTYAHATIDELARHATIPVINALSDDSHPCQAMADMLTIHEQKGRLAGLKLAFVGDGNNVARSLVVASALFGLEFVLACPEGYEFPPSFRSRFAARFPGNTLVIEHDPRKAVEGADIIYTDVWASMGQEHEAESRREIFAPYQVNEGLMARARADVIFLHCLPAHRNEEVTPGVLDGPRSKVIPQAANRMHFQMGLLTWLLGD